MPAKLHEILAVEPALEKTANKLIKESLHTLDKDSLFKGQVRRLEMFNEEDKKSETEEYQELTTTVDENIDYLTKPLSKWIDAVLQKDLTNQIAKADLIIDGKEVALDLPATFLLGMETKLNKIRTIYEAIPTTPPGINWVIDESERKGIFRNAHDKIQMKTKKDPEYRVVYEATDKHPAQVAQVDRTTDIGRYITTSYCGMMTPLEKAERITRIDNLLRAVKKARMRANSAEVVKANVGRKMLDYINKGELDLQKRS